MTAKDNSDWLILMRDLTLKVDRNHQSIYDEIMDLKTIMDTRFSTLEDKVGKHDGYFSLVGKTVCWLFGSVGLGGLFTWFFGQHK